MAKFRTYAIAKAEVLRPNSDSYKVVAERLKNSKYGFEVTPQIDLLYVRSCLVTAGINDNDDIFLKDELWAARKTPVLKPSNWQHNDKDILGVIYSVEARDLTGQVISIDQETAPSVPYELHTEAVVFKLVHPEKAEEIVTRAAKNELFVSMEAWFDNYDYGVQQADGSLKVIERNEQTSFLDTNLKARGGQGQYENQRLGRVLRNMTFGGQGFVNIPANKRSFIFEADNFENSQANSETALINMFKEMTMVKPGNTDPEILEVVETAVENTLSKRETKAKAAADEAAIKNRLEESDKRVKALEAELATVKQDVTSKDSQLSTLAQSLDEVVKALGAAPAEISKIDNANNVKGDAAGDAVFNAKIAWIKNSVATLKVQADKVTNLEAELHKAACAFRETEIREVFANTGLTDDEIKAFVNIGLEKSESEYRLWLKEKELIIAALLTADEVTETETEVVEPETKVESKNQFDTLTGFLDRRKAEIKPIPGSGDIKSGVKSGSLKNPKWKIAGGVDDDPSKVLDSAEPQKGVNLAGASTGDPDNQENPMTTLVKQLVSGKAEGSAKGKPSFDPVN